MEKWDLLHIGTAYIEVHTFKWKDYITVRDFSTITNALSKEILELEEENKKLNIKVASLEWEIKWLNSTIDKLKEENQTLELWLDNKEKLNEEYRKQIDKLKEKYGDLDY